MLKLLQWGEPGRSRGGSRRRPTCFGSTPSSSAFPDARFVMTHRDPTDVLLSVAEVYADIGGTFTDRAGPSTTSAG